MPKVAKLVATRPYPSEFGSHSSMIDTEATNNLPSFDACTKVVCKDQFGLYTTEKWRIDNNQADPNRYVGSRVKLS